MELTPIKVPGNLNSSQKHIQKRKEKASVFDPSRNSARCPKRIRKTRGSGTSMLERLPPEILEIIFFDCLNFALPRSSPRLSRILSNRYVYVNVIYRAFRNSWNEYRIPSDKGYASPNQTKDSREDSKLINDIIHCRWASLPLIMEAQKKWFEKLSEKYQKAVSNLFPNNSTTPGEAVDIKFKIITEKLNITGSLMDKEFLLMNFTEYSTSSVRIPERLITDPWPDENAKYLFWLITSGATIDPLRSTLAEIALASLRQAILLGDRRALLLLLWTGVLSYSDNEFQVSIIHDFIILDELSARIKFVSDDKEAIVDHMLSLTVNHCFDQSDLDDIFSMNLAYSIKQ